MYFWINFSLWILFIFLIGIVFALAMEPRWPKFPRWALAMVFTLSCLPVSYVKITHTGKSLGNVMYWVAVAIVLLYLLIPFKDKLWKKILLFVLFNIVTYIGEILCQLLAKYIGFSIDVSFDSLEMVLLVSADVVMILIFSSLLLAAWTRFANHKSTVRHFWLFFIFPVSQMMTIYFLNGRAEENLFRGNLVSCIGIVLGFIADFILLYVLMEQGEKEELARQLQEFEVLRQVQEVHYQTIESRREEIAKIRHDFNNQLTTAYHLTEQGDIEKARLLLDELQTDVARTKEYAYCGNAVVNAVLDEKASECEKCDIQMKTELEVADEPSIQPVHLCSIFSNLMDNAIRAAKACPAGQRFVSVRTSRRGDYLHIKVENSALEPKSAKTNDHKGYGKEILADIAFQYNGECQFSWKDGVYSAMISLTTDGKS